MTFILVTDDLRILPRTFLICVQLKGFFFWKIIFVMCHVGPLPKHVWLGHKFIKKEELEYAQKSTFWKKKIS